MEVINIFLAGSIKMEAHRNIVRSCANKLQADNCAKGRNISINITTFENFSSAITNIKAQDLYDEYIHNYADYAMFIFDDEVGGISKHEFDIAYDAFKQNNKPTLYIYFKESKTYCKEYNEIRNHILSTNNYFIEYKDINNLTNIVNSNLREIIEPKIEKIIINSIRGKGCITFLSNRDCSVIENNTLIATLTSNVPCTIDIIEGIHILVFKDYNSEIIEKKTRVIKDNNRNININFTQTTDYTNIPKKNYKYYFFVSAIILLVIGVAIIFLIEEESSESIEQQDELIELGGEKYQHALKAIDEGNMTIAIELLQTVINTSPSFADPYIHLAKIYKQQGNLKKAKRLLSKALELNPNSSWANQLYDSITIEDY